MFNSKTFELNSIKEFHEDGILDFSVLKTIDRDDERNGLIVSCSRDHTIRSFKYLRDDIVEIDEITDNELPVIGTGFIENQQGDIKLVYIDAKSNLCIREINENMSFGTPNKRNLSPRKFFSLGI